MKNNQFEFVIASPFEKEKLICEIYYLGELIVEISQENEELQLEIYPPSKKEWWSLPLLQFQEVLESAKNHLLKGG